MSSFLKKSYSLWRLQALLVFVQTGFTGLLYLLFFKEDVTLAQLFFGEFISSSVVSLYMLLRMAFFSRRDIQLGFLLGVVSFVLLFFPFTSTLFYAYVTLSGLAVMTFFTPYNILLFRQTSKKNSVTDMTWYWGVSIIASIVAPLVGAYILYQFGLVWFTSTAIVFSILGIFWANRITDEMYQYSPRQALTHLKGLRTITILDGGLHRVMRVVLIFGLVYISKEMDYGAFLSLMSIVAFVVALQIAKRADASEVRTRFIWPLSIAAGIATASFGFVHSIVPFVVLAIVLKGVSVMVEPFRGHVILDAEKNDPVGWIARELFLNIGRMLVMGIAALALFADNTQALFIMLGSIHVLFPVVLHAKKVYATTH